MSLHMPAPPRRIMPLPQSPVTYEVQGKKASDIEYYVALALEKLDIEFVFQVSLLGGKTVAG